MHRWGNKKDMSGDDPPYLNVGTEVSAKYRGAFCEAKIRKVVKTVKCKVQYKNEQGSVLVNEDQIKGVIMLGASVEVKQLEKKETVEGTIVKIQDLSQYTVVFDDGDIATLRRTALCLKSGRHFAESETLDQLPLTHPEHFSTPVVSGVRGSRRRDEMDENSDEEEKREPKIEKEEDMGKVVCVEIGDKKKTKDNWFPGLIVAPNAQDSVKIDVEDEYLVRSFKDGRYYTVPKSEATEFTREVGVKVDNATLKQAVEKAISFLDKSDLPPHWDRDQLFGIPDLPSDIDASDTDSTDDEPREEKDHFVAQLYKFMDDRGTPINKGPIISSKDVDLYRLFKLVYKLGGYNRVTNRNQWRSVTMKLGFSANQMNNVKSSYKKFLHSFEDFYRKLGCTLLTTSRDNKLRSRSTRPLIRDRDKAPLEKPQDKEETISSNSDDNSEVKMLINEKEKLETENKSEDNNEVDEKLSESKKDNGKSKVKKDQSVENIKDDEKFKKKFDIPLVKDFGLVQLLNTKENKDEKSSNDKRNDRKMVKSVPKSEESVDKKNEKVTLKTKNKRLKLVDKKISKTETASTIRSKRTLKERMKAIVQKFKLKSASNNENDKRKRITSDDLNKISSQIGVKVKNKEELLNSGAKSRKLSVGSNDGRTTAIIGGNSDKKVVLPTSSSSNVASPAATVNNNVFIKSKKSDEDLLESSKKKPASRKKKDDDKFTNNSSESLMNQVIEFVPHYKSIFIGDKLKVYYEPTHESKVTYEAKVTNKRYGTATEYLVHYTGWNTRYDEWIRRSRIADNLSWSPTRTKKKTNQTEPQSGNQILVHQNEPLSQQNQNIAKVPLDKSKRSSTSPVQKNRAKNSIKSGINKKMKNVKNKFESKTKKIPPQKDSENSSESDSEVQKKQELQKTRSRTEKQKQQEGDTVSMKELDSKKKPSLLKRTRSGSLKPQNNESAKKRKLQTTKIEKNGKGGNVRNSLKSLVSGKRVSNRIKDCSKDARTILDKDEDDSDIANNVDSGKEIDENKSETDEVKSIVEEDAEKSGEIKTDLTETDDKLLVLQIKPLNKEKIAELELAVLADNLNEPGVEVEVDNENLKFSEDSKPPVLKKEISPVEETNIIRITNQFLTGSYLSENLDNKPKIVKKKTKKDFDDKNCSPPKIFSRSLNEKNVTKLNNDVKEKTFFVSRSPSEKKTEKYEIGDKEKKDTKLRNINMLNSYLNMDKIDLLTKNINEKTNEKQTAVQKSVSDSNSSKNEDDIYEFKEPEPFDERTIPHRRPASRIFEDSNGKRPKIITSASNIVIRDNDELFNASEEMNINEMKSILDVVVQDDIDKLKSNSQKEFPSKNLKIDDICSSGDELVVTMTEHSDNTCSSSENKKSQFTRNFVADEVEVKMPNVESSTYVATVEERINLVVDQCVDAEKRPILGVADVEIENDELVQEAEDNENEDEDVEESKLVILENESSTGNVISFESKNKEYLEKVNEILNASSEKLKKQPTVGKATSIFVDEESVRTDLKTCLTDIKFIEKGLPDIPVNFNVENEGFQSDLDSSDIVTGAECTESENVTNESIPVVTALDEIDCKSVSSNGNKRIPKSLIDINEKNRVTVSHDSAEIFAEKIPEEHIAGKLDTESPTSCSSCIVVNSETKQKVIVKSETKIDDDSKVTVLNQIQVDKDLDPNSHVLQHQSIIDEVEIEIFTADKKSNVDIAENVNEKFEKLDETDEHSKLKDEDDETVDDGLLLCEETIPKSPESKDTLNDVDISYPSGSRISPDNNKIIPHKQLLKPNKKSSSSSLSAAVNTAYENTPPSTPGTNSTPGTSPSEENNGYSSATFVLNEKSALNKDSSENETCSDNSEKSLKIKKKYVEGENYHKKNSSEYESYLKKKIEKDSLYKLDEPPKKKSKIYSIASAAGSEKDDLSESGNSPKTSAASPQKSSVATILSDCPPDLDSNQRIEYLEQKLHSIKKAYNAFKQEVATIDRRRKKLRRKEREGRMMTRNEANSLL